MAVPIRIALWSFMAFPLWLLLSSVIQKLGLPLPRFFGATLAWLVAGLLLVWALPLFGQHLGLPWAFAHP